MNEEGLTVQPHIIVVGPEVNTVEKIYVVVDEIKYEVESAKQAIDICFKSFHVFHAEYPRPAEHVWLLIQRALYKFSTKSDKLKTDVIEIANDLKF